MDKIKKPLPMPLRYAINLAVFAVFLFGVNTLITGGSVPNYYTKVIVLCGINIILAVSLNVATGYLGQLPLGHAGFMAVGAYASALFLRAVPNLPEFVAFPLGIILGGVVSGIFGILIGIPALRLKGDYLAIITLGFGEIIRVVLLNIDSVLGFNFTYGAASLKNIPQIHQLLQLLPLRGHSVLSHSYPYEVQARQGHTGSARKRDSGRLSGHQPYLL